MRIIIDIFLKKHILDPQSKAVHYALESLNFNGIKKLSIDKRVILDLEETNQDIALEQAHKMAKDILVNSVIEEYSIKII